MKDLSVVILAAGEGTRMKSDIPKVMHHLAEKPMIEWVISAVKALKPEKICIVVGYRADYVKKSIDYNYICFTEQKKQLGSGHALIQARNVLGKFNGDIIVLCGDTPLIRKETLINLIKEHRSKDNDATVLSCDIDNPLGYGRIIRLSKDKVIGIVEDKDATECQKDIKEINSGIYCFSSPLIWNFLDKIKPNNIKKEYYLTDVIKILNENNKKVGVFKHNDPNEIIGINNRSDLAKAEKIIRHNLVMRWMLDGVTITDPDTTFISPNTIIGRDTILLPGTIIKGKTKIGSKSLIGPYTYIKDSIIGEKSEITFSFIVNSYIPNLSKIGPFKYITT